MEAVATPSITARIDAALELVDMELSETEQTFQDCLRRRAEREAKRKLEGELRRAAEEALRNEALEAAFDGELDLLLKAFDKGVEIEARDCHGTSLLSEASGGAQLKIVQMLLAEGADPNCRGRYGRTPLWRAAYSGCDEVTRELLRGGADPRECDEEGVRPIGVANGAAVRDLLASWDTTVTDDMRRRLSTRRQSQIRDADRERRERLQSQRDELNGAVVEAERRLAIGKGEVSKQRKLVQEYRRDRANFEQKGAQDRVAEITVLLERAEMTVKEAERIARELEWRLQRNLLKRREWETEQARKQLKALGRMPGFRVEVCLEGPESFSAIVARFTKDLELLEDYQGKNESGAVALKKGDVALLEGTLMEGRSSKEELEVIDLEAIEWPASIWFNHGFDAMIRIRELSDVVFKDPGGSRRADGRWPLVVDPSETSSKFFTYSGATKFSVAELQQAHEDEELEMRLRRAFLKGLLHGGAVVIDLENFDFSLETVGIAFERLERGLFGKLLDRSVLFSYLMPRRFTSLVTEELQSDFASYLFVDEHVAEFVLCFVTSRPEPDPDFSAHFYTIRVRDVSAQEVADMPELTP